MLHSGQVDTAAGVNARRLLAHGGNTHDGGAQATEERSEKLSDSILGTHEAILKVSEKGRWVTCCRGMTLCGLVLVHQLAVLQAVLKAVLQANTAPGHNVYLCSHSDKIASMHAPQTQLDDKPVCVISGDVHSASELPIPVRPASAYTFADVLLCSALSQLDAHHLLVSTPPCSVNKATAIGNKMTAAATDPAVSHREESKIDVEKAGAAVPKRLMARRLMGL